MDAGLDITTSLAANWLPWLCVAMLCLVWLSCVMQPQYLRGLINNSFAPFDVNAADQIPSIGSQIAQWMFNITIPAIGAYTLVAQDATYGVGLFSRILLAAFVIEVLRTLTALLVQYTFRLGKMQQLAYMRYFSLRSLFTFALMAEILCITYTTAPAWAIILMLLTIVAYMVVLGVQWGKLLCQSVMDILSIAIYLLTVELLPLILLYGIAAQQYMQQ